MSTLQTVLGPVSADELGVTLTHEHLLVDCTVWYEQPTATSERAMAEAPVSLDNLWWVRRNFLASLDNLRLTDLDVATEEALAFRQLGGGTIVDVTPRGIGQDPLALRAVSAATGLHIVMGCGYYIHAAHPPHVAEWGVEELAEEMLRDLTEGVDGTGIRAGVIGEVGTSDPITGDEEKVLRAAALAHKETGVAINIHPQAWSMAGIGALDIVLAEGVDPARVIMSHCDGTSGRGGDADLMTFCEAVGERGAYIEFDTFGFESYIDITTRAIAGGDRVSFDFERVAALVKLIEKGYLERLLLSQDVFIKLMLRKYGGWGYGHISQHIEPMMRRRGVSEAEIRMMRVENPARVHAG